MTLRYTTDRGVWETVSVLLDCILDDFSLELYIHQRLLLLLFLEIDQRAQ